METIGEKIRHVSQPAEVLVGTEKNIVEEQTESAKSTETISEPMQLIPIEEVPAGAVKKGRGSGSFHTAGRGERKTCGGRKYTKLLCGTAGGYAEWDL